MNSTPHRPQGKGKIERLYETVENQFITWVRVQIKDNPGYTLAQLNKDLDEWIQNQYHVRVHTTTKETPAARFFKEHLRVPDPPVDVVKYLERSSTRRVSKTGEVSYNGYKIQVALPAYSRVIVVETIETVRIEYGTGFSREIKKHELSKESHVKRQDGLSVHAIVPTEKQLSEEISTEKHPNHHDHPVYGPDEEGFSHRKANCEGRFKWRGSMYLVGIAQAGKEIIVRLEDNKLHVFDKQRNSLISLDIKEKHRT